MKDKLWEIRAGNGAIMKLRAPDYGAVLRKAARFGMKDIRDVVLIED